MENNFIGTKFKLNVDFDKKLLEIDERDYFNNVLSRHVKNVIDTKEKMIRDGLIALGWTPPDDTV